jgi:hypothetical protein
MVVCIAPISVSTAICQPRVSLKIRVGAGFDSSALSCSQSAADDTAIWTGNVRPQNREVAPALVILNQTG